MTTASIALNRFGLGARRDDVVPADPVAWLLGQFDRFVVRPPAIAAAPTVHQATTDLAAYQLVQRARRMQRAADQPPAGGMAPAPAPMSASVPGGTATTALPPMGARSPLREDYVAAVGARTSVAVATDTPFVERLVHFWANHFAVSADKQTVIPLAGPLEFEAIRPHVLGRFGDMLGAVERHPAMLLYLDQAQSIGPDSPIGLRVAARGVRKAGLNENLAREILELHTLGVRTGYAQADVTEFARALTGWTVAGLGRGQGAVASGRAPGDFLFAAAIHQPGERRIVGRTYPAGGEAQAQAVLADLAVHPATARHIATKLTRHFAADDPPPAMVARLERAFLASGGDLPSVYRAIVASPEAWAPGMPKFRTPWEWGVGTMRALGYREVPGAAALGLMNQLGQPVWKPGQPIGWDDAAASWAGPDALVRRVEAAERFATRAGAVDARRLAPRLFPGGVSAATTQALARADSPGQALALLLVSPEAMRR